MLFIVTFPNNDVSELVRVGYHLSCNKTNGSCVILHNYKKMYQSLCKHAQKTMYELLVICIRGVHYSFKTKCFM